MPADLTETPSAPRPQALRASRPAPAPEPLFERAPVVSRWRLGAGAAVVLALAALAAAVLIGLLAPSGGDLGDQPVGVLDGVLDGAGESEAAGAGGVASGGPTTIIVHVSGAVREPGVYELAVGSRAIDGVAAAGGFTGKADESQLNLARVLSDGEQLAVPRAGEAGASSGSTVGAGGGSGLVDLNTAGASELDTLPRIGPALAARIIAWRESNGAFRAVDDLLSVPGIGPATLEGLRGLVSAG